MNHLACTYRKKQFCRCKHTIPAIFILTFCLFSSTLLPHATTFGELSYEDIFERSALVRMIIDAETGDIVLVNDAAEAFYGYSEEQLLSMSIQDINMLDDQQVYEKRMEALREGTNLFNFDHQLANGDIRSVEVYTHPFETDGRAYLQTTIYDITPKLAALEKVEQNRNKWIVSLLVSITLLATLLLFMLQRRLEKKENIRRLEKQIIRYQALVQDKMTMPWEYNQESGEYSFSNQPLNLKEGLLVDNPYQQRQGLKTFTDKYVHPDDSERVLNEFLAYIRDPLSYTTHPNNMYEDTFRIRSPQGKWHWVLSRGKILRQSELEVLTVGLMIDIETLKQLEGQLLLEKEKAEEMTLAKAHFLASMSHELRTPLNGIMGMLQVLQLTELQEEQEECIDAAYQSSKSLLSLINDILDYSKLQSGELIIREDLINVKHIGTQVLKLMSPEARHKGIELSLQVDEAVPPWLMGDELRIKQILFNLVGNAVKFTQEGYVKTTITIEGVSDQQVANICIEVEDTGVGISEAFIPYLFDRFTQADETIRLRVEGTGLGLAISKQLTELMGGEIGVKSRKNTGSTFCVTFPLKIESMSLRELKQEVKLSEKEVKIDAPLPRQSP